MALCLLGPLFFLSYIFTILSPLPLLYLHSGNPNARQGRLWLLVAAIIGTGVSVAIKGLGGGLAFLALSVIPSLVLGEVLKMRHGPVRAIGAAFLATIAATLIAAYTTAYVGGFELGPKLRTTVEAQVKMVTDRLLSQNPSEIPTDTAEDLKSLAKDPALIYAELPGIVATALLLLCTLPCLALIRWNPKGFLRRTGISRDYLRKWRSPEWMVWPALFCGVFLIFPMDPFSLVANNLLKPILLIYFFQGMSILAY
ncbi:MAG: DUF2232 domain-containing protein, partial [Proteobacteria bacterium]